MKITDIKKEELPIRVRLTEAFTLEESFDPGMIVQINNYKGDWETDLGEVCYEVYVTALASDYEYNNSVSRRDWLDKDSEPTLNIFEAIQQRRAYNPEKDDWKDTIYVMENDEAFELVESDFKIKEDLEKLLWCLVDDTLTKWSSYSEEEDGIQEYVEKILKLCGKE